MVLPTFDYVDYVWDRNNIGENNELQLLQNKALRLVYRVKLEQNPTHNTDQLHILASCSKLFIRRDMHLLFYAFSLKKRNKYIDERALPTRRGQGIRLLVPRSHKPIVVRSCLYRAIIRWNMLKPSFTEIEDLNQFKLAIKKGYGNCFM